MREHKSEFEKVISRSKLSNSNGVKGCLLAMAGRTDTTHYLSEIKVPVLLVCGEEDKLTPPDVMKLMDVESNHISNRILEQITLMRQADTSIIGYQQFAMKKQ